MEDFRFPPEFLEEFEVLEVVGAGGMARVYRARNRATERVVAIKVLAPQAFSEEDSRKRFEREREVTAGLKHPNIVPLLSFGDAGGRPYLVFEFVEGPSVRDVLLRERRLALTRSLRYARHIAQGLAAAHAAGVVHRDLKPDNVLIADVGDEARVADFGLARETTPTPGKQRLTQTGIILGTPGYLAPELIRGEPATPSADLFSLGIMLFEMITGYLPLDAGSEHEMLIRYLREDLPPLSSRGVSAPRRVENLVAALLRRDLSRRADNASRVAEHLANLEAKGEAPDGPATRAGHEPRPRSRGASLTRHGERPDLSVVGPRLTPFSGARFIRKHPRTSAAALAMVAALIVGALGALVFLAGPEAAPRPDYAVMGTPAVIAGVTSASIRWQTSREIPTALRIWQEGQSDLEGKAVMPPAGAPRGGLRHELTVRGLSGGQRWLFNVLFPDGARSSKSYQIVLRADMRAMVSDPTFRYQDAEHVEVGFEVKEEVTAGVLLSGVKDAAPGWAPGRGPRRVTLSLPVPPGGSVWAPVALFRELDDAGDNLARNRVELPRFPALEVLRKQIQDLYAPPRVLDLNPVTGEIFRLVTKYYHIPKDRMPSKEQVRALDEKKRESLLEEVRRLARQRLLAARQLDLDLVASAVPLWRADAPLPAGERRRLHASLMRLADLDGAAELIAGTPLIGFDRDLGLRVPAAPNERIPPNAFRPLDHFTEPLVQQVVREHALPLFTHTDFGAGEKVVAMWMLAGDSANVVECVRMLALPDPGDPRAQRGMSQRLPGLPADFPVDGPLRIVVVATSLTPEYRLWLKIGGTSVCFRSSLADFHGFVPVPMRASRAEVLERAQVMAVELPAGYVEPGARSLALRLEAFPTHEGGQVSAPMTCWIADVALIPGK